MRACLLAVLLLGSPAFAQTVSVTQTQTSNGTTLPFQRHVVRVGPARVGEGTLVFAVQKQGSNGDGLVLYTSRDEGRTWARSLVVQGDAAVRDTADLVADENGNGFSLLYGVEPRSSQWTADARFDVVYLHYAVDSAGTVTRDVGPIQVFVPTSSQGWFRPSLERDDQGVLHATATRLSGGTFAWFHRLSIDGGREWTPQEELANFGSSFGGGRIVSAGAQLVAIFDSFAAGQSRFRTRPAGPCAEWDDTIVFGTDGLYHAGAFSAVATPDGHIHLGYSNRSNQRLWYREFDGLSWSAAFLIENTGWWTNQPALAVRGDEVLYGWNRNVSGTGETMTILLRRKVNGSWGAIETIDSEVRFKGYTTSAPTVLAGERWPLAWCQKAADPSAAATVRLTPVP